MIRIVNLTYYKANGNKTYVEYEKNGINKKIELNGILTKEVAKHVIEKRGF